MPVEYWDGKRLATAIGSAVYRGGYFDPNGGHVNPMKLVRVFKAAAERAGASVYENTVIEQVDAGPVHTLSTRDGHLVRCNRWYWPATRSPPTWDISGNSILPLREYVGITRPLSEQERSALGWHSRVPFNDRGRGLLFGLTADRRVHIGGGAPQYSFNNAPPTSSEADTHRRRLAAELARVFPLWQASSSTSCGAGSSIGH